MSFAALVNKQLDQLRKNDEKASVANHITLSPSGERFDLSIAFCGTNLRFTVECFTEGIDCIPASPGVPPDAIYGVYSLDSLPVMKTWRAEDSDGLELLASQIRRSFSSNQVAKVEAHMDQRIPFNYDAIKTSSLHECYIDEFGEVHFQFLLFDESVDQRLRSIRAQIGIPPGDRSSPAVSLLSNSRSMPATSKLILPKWNLAKESLFDYLPSLRASLLESFAKRKEFMEALSAKCSVLEYDNRDYSRICVLVKSNYAKSKVFRLLLFELSCDFPVVPPTMTLLEFAGSQTFKLDPVLYRYSPRWPCARMADELFQHALTVNNQAWQAPATNTHSVPPPVSSSDAGEDFPEPAPATSST